MTRRAFAQVNASMLIKNVGLIRALMEQYPILRETPDGAIYCCEPLLMDQGHIVGPCDELGHDNEWMYATFEEAVRAMVAWDGEGEPQGWTRHMPSGRR